MAVALRIARRDGDVVLLLPITTKSPKADDDAIEIPTHEKRKAGLDQNLRLWVVVDEFNQDIVGRSFDLLPEPPLGSFGKAFFEKVLRAFVATRADARGISRRT